MNDEIINDHITRICSQYKVTLVKPTSSEITQLASSTEQQEATSSTELNQAEVNLKQAAVELNGTDIPDKRKIFSTLKFAVKKLGMDIVLIVCVAVIVPYRIIAAGYVGTAGIFTQILTLAYSVPRLALTLFQTLAYAAELKMQHDPNLKKKVTEYAAELIKRSTDAHVKAMKDTVRKIEGDNGIHRG